MRESGSGTRELFDEAIRSAGLGPLAPFQTIDDTEAIKQAVIAGQGATCLPAYTIEQDLLSRRLEVLIAPFLNRDRQLWRVTRIDSVDSPLLDALERLHAEPEQRRAAVAPRVGRRLIPERSGPGRHRPVRVRRQDQ